MLVDGDIDWLALWRVAGVPGLGREAGAVIEDESRIVVPIGRPVGAGTEPAGANAGGAAYLPAGRLNELRGVRQHKASVPRETLPYATSQAPWPCRLLGAI
jgi:hypothetical protein